MRPQLKPFQIIVSYGSPYVRSFFRNYFTTPTSRQTHENGMTNSMNTLLNRGGIHKQNFNYNTGLTGMLQTVTAANSSQYVFAITQITVSIDDIDGPSITTQNLAEANQPPHEFFFTEDLFDDGRLKASLLQKVLEAFIRAMDDGDNIYENKTGFVSMIITAYPFETLEGNLIDSGAHPNVEVIFVNGTRHSLSVAYGKEFGKSIALASQFLAAIPNPPTKQLVFVMHSGQALKLPQDQLSVNLFSGAGLVTAGAMQTPHKGNLLSIVEGRRHSKSLTDRSPGDRASKFGAGVNAILGSGEKALTAAIARQRRRVGDIFTSKEPGGHSFVLLMAQGRLTPGVLAHELSHVLGDLSIYKNKFLSNPNAGLDRKAAKDLEGYQEWCGFRPPEIPAFDSTHTRPALKMRHLADLGCSVVLSMAGSLSGKNRICPVDVADLLSYSGHPLTMLGCQVQRMQTLGASGGETRCITGTLFEFYMFAGAILMIASQKEVPEESQLFITSTANYSANLNRVAKNTPSYNFLELLNYGEDDLAISFKPGIGAATSADEFLSDFISARKEFYELEYSDSTIGEVDILKVNNSHKQQSINQQDDSSQFGEHTLHNHVSTTVLDAIGFEALAESDEMIEVFNGEPVKTRSGASLTQDTKFHRLVISKARGDTLSNLQKKHEPNAHGQEIEMLRAVYNGEAIPHQLAFPKEDGSGDEEMKYVYLIVKDKANLNVQSGVIFDNAGRSLLL